jgi:hypothetical protein
MKAGVAPGLQRSGFRMHYLESRAGAIPAVTRARKQWEGNQMCLAEFQRAFADPVATPRLAVASWPEPDGLLARHDLTAQERRRLRGLLSHPGLTLVYSVLPLTCGLLRKRLIPLLETFSGLSRDPTGQYGREAVRFGGWLQEQIAAGVQPGGPVEDALAFELAAFEVRTAGPAEGGEGTGVRTTWVHFRYEPEEVLNPSRGVRVLQPLSREAWLLLDCTAGELKVYRVRAADGSAPRVHMTNGAQ